MVESGRPGPGPEEPGARRAAGSGDKDPPTITGTGDGGISRVASFAGFQLAGVWLMTLIAVSVFTAIVIFGATQFQIRLASLTLYGGPLSVWKAEELRQSWASSLEVLEAAKQALNADQQALAQAITASNHATTQVNIDGAEADSALRRIAEKIRRIDPVVGDKLNDDIQFYDAVALISAEMPSLSTKDKSLEQDFKVFEAAVAKYNAAYDISYARSKDISRLETAVERDKQNLASAQESSRLRIPAREGEKIPEDQKSLIENAIYEFHAMRDFLFGMVYGFAVAPSDILVLVLVVAMGLLGSSLHLAYIYLTEFDRHRISFYVFRPFLGVIMAFAVFIIAKAGIPVLTDASRYGGDAPINPYLISFLAILSGLMSERALISLRQLGSSYFREGDGSEPPRWARKGVGESLAAAGREPADLRSYLDAEEPEIQNWIEGKKPIPSAAQTVIAAILQSTRRELFTDMAPRNADNPHAA